MSGTTGATQYKDTLSTLLANHKGIGFPLVSVYVGDSI
jgi:hypothetical protein